MGNLQRLPDLLIGMFGKRIKIKSETSGKDNRILRNDGDVGSQLAETQSRDVDAVDEDAPRSRLQDAEQRRRQRGFAGAGAADDADALATVDGEVDFFEDEIEAGTIPDGEVVDELDGAGSGPVAEGAFETGNGAV